MSLNKTSASPWRALFEATRGALRGRRDAQGVVGSINWLRTEMAARGANPNVVRNIIYRDKGKLADKRVLFAILSELWEGTGQAPLELPELELLLSGPTGPTGDLAGLLGRDKRGVYQNFVGAVRSGTPPKLLVTGRPGSGKTLLTDAVQGALEGPGRLRVVRQEFAAGDLAPSLQGLALALGVPQGVLEAKLVRVGTASAYAVQADAQADVARTILERVRTHPGPLVLLLHVSQSAGAADTLSDVPLRLSTPDVPRVGMTEWLWHTLLEPLARTPRVGLLVSLADLPHALQGRTAGFGGPVKLSPPTVAEARRFVRARAPGLSAERQEELVAGARRSFEDLRTLTLLAEAREPTSGERGAERLGRLVVESANARLRDFLETLAVLALPEFPAVAQGDLEALRGAEPAELTSLELAFLDAVPGEPNVWRPFSRRFARALRRELRGADPERFRARSLAAGRLYEDLARAAPRGDAAGRYAHHLFAARAWSELVGWADRAPVPQSLLTRLWASAQGELAGDLATLRAVALQVAATYVRLGSTDHPDAAAALSVLAAGEDPWLRAWAGVKRAESAFLEGRLDEAEGLLEGVPEPHDPELALEAALLRAHLERRRARPGRSAALVREGLEALGGPEAVQDPALALRLEFWRGLMAKDEGDLEAALKHFRVPTDDDLARARLRFGEADVLVRLGHLGAARRALDEAVAWSRAGEAPAPERARYLARRGTVWRRQGALAAAEADFAAAHTALEGAEEPSPLRLAFERAKVRGEEAHTFVAAGRPDRAIAALQGALETFAAYRERYGTDLSFRVLRARLRLAAAYGARALGSPASLPPVWPLETPDLHHARRLVGESLAALAREPERYPGLALQARLCAAHVLPPASATEAAQALLADPYPYGRARAHTYLAGALLRGGDPEGALGALGTAGGEFAASGSDDFALAARLELLTAGALLDLGRVGDACERVARALGRTPLEPYGAALLYRFGEAAERAGLPVNPAALGLGPAPLPGLLRPADALVLRWRERAAEALERAG